MGYLWRVAALVPLAVGHLGAQNGNGRREVSEWIRQEHMVHVSPHLIVFDPTSQSATVEFSNSGNTATEADVRIELGYTHWQNVDTVLFTPNWKTERAHDTVIANPGPNDRYAGPWLSGVPAHITLKPHEKQRFILRINPPKDLPNGEYYARIVTLAGRRTRRDQVSKDTKLVYALPLVGKAPPLIRDSVRVFYRQGPQSMGLRIFQARAQIDSADDIASEVGQHPLLILVRVHLTGTTHFEGYLSASYLTAKGDEIPLTAVHGAAFTIHSDCIMRWSGETDQLQPGHYTLILKLIELQDEFPPWQRLPMQPVQVNVPFDKPF